MTDARHQVETPLEIEAPEPSVLPFSPPPAPEVDDKRSFVEALATFLVRCPAWRISPNASRLQRSTELAHTDAAQALNERLFGALLRQVVRYEVKRVETWVEVTLPLLEGPTLLALLETLEAFFQAAESPPKSPARPPLGWRAHPHGA